MSHTCEDCRYFDREWCAFHRECVVANDPAVTKRCKAFEVLDKPTVFEQITQSHEALAEKLVYETVRKSLKFDFGEIGDEPQVVLIPIWRSSVIPDQYWENKQEAFTATVSKLKEV